MFSLMMVTLASCTDDSSDIQLPEKEIIDLANVKLITDQSKLASRLVFVAPETIGSGSRAVEETPAPSIPTDALKLKDQPTNGIME